MSATIPSPELATNKEAAIDQRDYNENHNETGLLYGGQSPGVRRIEAISSQFTLADRVFLFLAIFLIAYVYGLDLTIRYTYQVQIDP
jgi:hypothetical protein